MIVVSDTSPLLNLAAVGRADLLGALYGVVIIPPAVASELDSVPRRFARFAVAMGTASLDFVRTEPLPANVDAGALLAELALRVDYGEAEALALSIARPADLFLTDDLPARRLATARGVRTQGLLGVLLEAKRRRLLSAVAPLLDRLIHEAAFRVGADLRARFIESAGEGE